MSLQSTGHISPDKDHSRADTTDRVSSSESEQESESEDSKGLPLVSRLACKSSKLSGTSKISENPFNGRGESPSAGDAQGCHSSSPCFTMSIGIAWLRSRLCAYLNEERHLCNRDFRVCEYEGKMVCMCVWNIGKDPAEAETFTRDLICFPLVPLCMGPGICSGPSWKNSMEGLGVR